MIKKPYPHLLGASLLLAASCAAQAQTNVTLYGRVVAGVDYQNNIATLDAKGNPTGEKSSLLRAAGNQWGTSMLGFRGTEDLGAGLQAIFQLEGGFEAPKGASGGFSFNRRSIVGLKSANFGTLTLGRNIPLADAVWAIDPSGQQFTGTATLVRGRNWQGYNNMISYETPNWGGVTGQLVTSLGEQTGSNTKGRKDMVQLIYAQPSFDVRVIYDLIRDSNGQYSDVWAASKELTVGGTWTINALKLFGGYQRLTANNTPTGVVGANGQALASRANHYWVGARYQVTPAMTLIGAMYRVNVNNGNGSANLFQVGTDYALSKRTLLYASVGTVRNSSNANFSVEATNNNPSYGGRQMGVYAGMAHSF